MANTRKQRRIARVSGSWRRTIVRFGIGLAGLALFAPAPALADPASTSPEQGYDLGDIHTPRSVGMGDAQVASGASTTALYRNPAALPMARLYHLEAMGSVSPEARRQSYGASIVDSSTSRLAGGFGGTWNQLDPDGVRRRWTDLRLALAYPLGDALSIGLAGRYLRVNQGVASGPFGPSFASDGTRDEPLMNEFTFDAGALLVPTRGLSFGVAGKNLTAPGTSLAPTTLTGGVAFAQSIFVIEADAMADFTTWGSTRGRFMLGGEVFLAEHVPIRAGYRYAGGQLTHGLSLGTGYVDRQWSVELSGRRDIAGEHPMTLVTLALKFFYDAASGAGTPGP